MYIPAPMLGMAGELRVRSELLRRGIGCGKLDFDGGTDIILENGKKIGVKTSEKPINDKKNYSWKYSFSIRAPQVREAKDGLYTKKFIRRDYTGLVDYWVFWCIQDDKFYIIPNSEIGQKISITIPTPEHLRKYNSHGEFRSTSRFEKYKNNWEQLR